jgi:hypothetical protein
LRIIAWNVATIAQPIVIDDDNLRADQWRAVQAILAQLDDWSLFYELEDGHIACAW